MQAHKFNTLKCPLHKHSILRTNYSFPSNNHPDRDCILEFRYSPRKQDN